MRTVEGMKINVRRFMEIFLHSDLNHCRKISMPNCLQPWSLLFEIQSKCNFFWKLKFHQESKKKGRRRKNGADSIKKSLAFHGRKIDKMRILNQASWVVSESSFKETSVFFPRFKSSWKKNEEIFLHKFCVWFHAILQRAWGCKENQNKAFSFCLSQFFW